MGNQVDYDSIPVELTITKNVTGSLGDRTKEFTFTLTVEGAGENDEYTWTKNGVAQGTPLHNNSTFTLKHGDVVKIMLPRNRYITIQENVSDYSVSMKLDDADATEGNTKTFQISKNATLAVTNDRDAVVPTGVFHSMNIAAYVIMAICLLIMMSILILRTHKYRPKASSFFALTNTDLKHDLKEALLMNKIKAKNIIMILLAVICVAVLLYSLYQGLIIYIPQKQEQHRFDELRQSVLQDSEGSEEASDSLQSSKAETKSSFVEEKKISAFSELTKINADFRGWLKIKDMVIDYPVVQSSNGDPEFYLHRDIDKNYSFSGTPFIGAGADENSDAFVIYAHNMNRATPVYQF